MVVCVCFQPGLVFAWDWVSLVSELQLNILTICLIYIYDLIPPFQDKSICSAWNCRIMAAVINLDHDEYEISKPAISYIQFHESKPV